MKKQESKKLSLNRETVGNLDRMELKNVAGGLYQYPIVSSDNRECTYSRDC